MKKIIFITFFLLLFCSVQTFSQKFVWGDLKVSGDAYIKGNVISNSVLSSTYMEVDSILLNSQILRSAEGDSLPDLSWVRDYVESVSYVELDSSLTSYAKIDSSLTSYAKADSSLTSYAKIDSVLTAPYMVVDSSLTSYAKVDSILIGSQIITHAEGDSVPDLAWVRDYANTNFTGALTDGAPTAAEIVGIAGTAASSGAGSKAVIKDNDGTALYYLVISDGTGWYYFTGTLAL